MPYLVTQPDSDLPTAMFTSLARAKAVAKEESKHLPPALDGAVICVWQALPPSTTGESPRPDPNHPHPLACYIDGQRLDD